MSYYYPITLIFGKHECYKEGIQSNGGLCKYTSLQLEKVLGHLVIMGYKLESLYFEALLVN